MITKSDIYTDLTNVFRNTLENNQVTLEEQTAADDIEEWDSLAHIQLIVAIEKHFKIRFTTYEISSFQNVGEMVDNIFLKVNSI